MKRKWWFAEILIGVYLTVAVFSLGYSLSSLGRLPSAPEPERENYWIDQWAEPLKSLGLWAFKDSISVYTLLLTGTTVWLAVITLRSVNLGRQEFVATHRARIRVLYMEDTNMDSEETNAGVITYVNVGDIDAQVDAIASRFVSVTGTPEPGLPLEVETVAATAKSGVLQTSRLGANTLLVNLPKVSIMDSQFAGELLCIGYVRYSDVSGAERRTGFCFGFGSDGLWHAKPQSDYAYEY